jgi:hypothetical protein
MVSSSMSFLVNYVTASVGGSRALVDHFLEAVAIEVPLDRILDGVGALEEFFAFFLLVSTAVGIQIFVEEFPHIIGQAEDFQVFGVLESVLEFLGHGSEVFGFPHDFADESLLAVQVIVVEFFIQILEHGDPLDDVHSLVSISISVGSILVLGIGVSVVFLALGIVVISVVSRVGAEKTAHIDQVANDSEENESSQKGKGSGGA